MHSAAIRHPVPTLTLFLLAPVIGEVLFGAVPLSRLPFGLLGLIGMYGGGALLVREIVRRRRLASAWLVLLGIAYGILEEGTVLQSLFDQRYPGLDFLGFYGHAAGVNWVWAEFILPYHAVFSIALPIALTELIFPGVEEEAWLGPVGAVAAAGLFVLNGVLLAVFKVRLFTSRAPDTSLWANLVAALCAAALVFAAFRAAPRPPTATSAHESPQSPRRMRLIALASGLAWFVGLRVLLIGDGKNLPAPVVLIAGAATAVVIWWNATKWSPSRSWWTPEHTYAVIAGALPTSWLLGFLIAAVSGGSIVLNLAGHAVFGVLMFVALHALHRRIRQTQPDARVQPAQAGLAT
jgi:hypothetical protein